jgi:hypothetical protein
VQESGKKCPEKAGPGPQLFSSILEVQPCFKQGLAMEISASFSYF